MDEKATLKLLKIRIGAAEFAIRNPKVNLHKEYIKLSLCPSGGSQHRGRAKGAEGSTTETSPKRNGDNSSRK